MEILVGLVLLGCLGMFAAGGKVVFDLNKDIIKLGVRLDRLNSRLIDKTVRISETRRKIENLERKAKELESRDLMQLAKISGPAPVEMSNQELANKLRDMGLVTELLQDPYGRTV